MTGHDRRTQIAACALQIVVWLTAPSLLRAETQKVPVTKTGWLFIAFQVQPVTDDPATVLGSDWYDHVWGYDPDAGWSHYSPRQELLQFNDLDRIEALRGYWVHATALPPGGEISVTGAQPRTQVLSGGTSNGAGWHAIGTFGGPGRMTDAFSGLDAATIAQSVAEMWRYDEQFVKVYDSCADTEGGCLDVTCPGTNCLTEGTGYWVRTKTAIHLGSDFKTSTDCVVLAPGSPIARLGVTYAGGNQGAARMQTANVCVPRGEGGECPCLSTDATSGLCVQRAATCCSLDRTKICSTDADCTSAAANVALVAARTAIVDEQSITELDTNVGPADGPDDAATCGSTRCTTSDLTCANLCFKDQNSGNAGNGRYDLYVGLKEDDFYRLAAAGSFSSCDKPYTTLVLDGTPPGGGGAAATGAPPLRRVVNVAVQPPVMDGDYAGRLSYSKAGLGGDVPLRIFLDGCVTDDSGKRVCNGTTRVTGIINPRLLTQGDNGLDDDGDGEIDEPDEAQQVIIPTRRALSFPREMILHGEISDDQRFLKLSGKAMVPNIAFAGSSASPRPDGGIASLFVGAERELTLEGYRTALNTFRGLFSERYKAPNTKSGELLAEGVFELSRVVGPQCMARDPARTNVSPPDPGGQRTVPLGIFCRETKDCPKRCVYSQLPATDKRGGLPCAADTDCPSLQGSTGTYAGQCLNYKCGSFVPAPNTASGDALHHTDPQIQVTLNEPPGGLPVLVEVVGNNSGFPENRVVTVDAAGGATLNFNDLPCGPYTVRLTAAGCFPVEKKVCACSTDTDCPVADRGPVLKLQIPADRCPGRHCSIDNAVCATDQDCQRIKHLCRLGVCSHDGSACTLDSNCDVPQVCVAGLAPAFADSSRSSMTCTVYQKTGIADRVCAGIGLTGGVHMAVAAAQPACDAALAADHCTHVCYPPPACPSSDPQWPSCGVCDPAKQQNCQLDCKVPFPTQLTQTAGIVGLTGIVGQLIAGGIDARLDQTSIVRDDQFHERLRTGLLPMLAGPTVPVVRARYLLDGNALDASGNGNDGTVGGTVTFGTGIHGQAAQFGGSGYISVPRSVGDNFTLAFWVKTTETAATSYGHWWGGHGLVDGEVAGLADDFGTALLNNKVAFGVGNPDTTIVSTSPINDGAWHHIAATRDSASGQMALYVDGALQASTIGPSGARAAPPSLRIGALQTGVNFFVGAIDDVALFDGVLSGTQIASVMSTGLLPTAAAGGQ